MGDEDIDKGAIRQKLITPNPDRIPYLLQALVDGYSIQELMDLTRIDPWFLHEMKDLADMTRELSNYKLETLPVELLREAKRNGFSDTRIARLIHARPAEIAGRRFDAGIIPVYKR